MFKLYDEKMNEIELPEGLIPLDIFISSIDKQRITTRVDGSNRTVNLGSTFNNREITLSIGFKSPDTQDYRLLRDMVAGVLTIEDEFYVAETYQPGKKYLISVDQHYIPTRLNKYVAHAEVECTKIGLPFAESIGTTQDIEENGGITYDSELWSYGMGLLHDDESHKYTHTSKEFEIYNAGSVAIHPFEQELKIAIENVSSGYTLENLTTGDAFKYTGSSSGDIELNGPNITLNNLQVLRDTNKEFITLAPGWNTFRQNQSRKVSFDFRFYYL